MCSQTVWIADNSLSPGTHFPNQPGPSKASTECNSLTYWWGATMWPPEMNDVSLAEAVVITMRVAAPKEMKLNVEVDKPTLQMILEFDGERMEPAVESTPHTNAMIFNSTYEGVSQLSNSWMMALWTLKLVGVWPECKLVKKFRCVQRADIVFQQVHDRRLKKSSARRLRLPLPRGRSTGRPEQGNNWDQCGDSSSAASASAEEGERGAHSKSERDPYFWGPWPPSSVSSNQVQPTQKYDVQPANRGSNPWTDWAREVRNSQPDYRVSSANTWHVPAGGAHAWGQKWSSQSSGWSRSHQWSAPTTKILAGPDYDIDHDFLGSCINFA